MQDIMRANWEVCSMLVKWDAALLLSENDYFKQMYLFEWSWRNVWIKIKRKKAKNINFKHLKSPQKQLVICNTYKCFKKGLK